MNTTALSLEPQRERAVRAGEAAEILGVSRTTFYGLIHMAPGFPSGCRLGKSRLWLVSDLLAYARRQQESKQSRILR